MLHHRDLLLIAGEAGLAARLGNGRFVPVRTDMAGVLEGITGMVTDAHGYLWLNGSRGLVRLETGLLRRAVRNGLPVMPRLFDAADGMPGMPCRADRSPPQRWPTTACCGWPPTRAWPGWTPPARTSIPMAPACASARCCMAAARAATRWSAPTGRHQPAADRLRGAVVGVRSATDTATACRAWMTAGRTLAAARAYYTNLAPGSYRFEVEAANEDGIWSTAPASRSFRIAPTFMQTLWFAAVHRRRACTGAGRTHPQRPAGGLVPRAPAGAQRRTRTHRARPARHPAAG